MRRTTMTLLALVFLLAGADALHAQTRFGAKVGMNFAKLEFDDADDPEQDFRSAFTGGVYMTMRANEFISFQPEVLYSPTGSESEMLGGETQLDLSYIQVPVLALFNFAPGSTIRPHLALGPYIAFNIGCDLEVEIDGAEGEGDCDEAGFDAEGIDWGGVFGGGLNFHGSRGVLTIDGRYNLGLADVVQDDTEDDSDVNNRFWNLLVGFSIPVGGI